MTHAGETAVTARGVYWNTVANPTVANATTNNGGGTGVFTSTLTKLSAGTTYYVRAYATNSAGTSYGTQHAFTTPGAIGPDFVITNIVLSPGLPAAGGKITAMVTVQ